MSMLGGFWRSLSSTSPAKGPRPGDEEPEDLSPSALPKPAVTRAATTPVAYPKATPETFTEELDKTGSDKEEVRSIRAPLSVIDDEDDDEEDEEADAAEDDFVSTIDKGEVGSISSHSFGSIQSVSAPVAKVTIEGDDFNLPAKLGTESSGMATPVDLEDEEPSGPELDGVGKEITDEDAPVVVPPPPVEAAPVFLPPKAEPSPPAADSTPREALPSSEPLPPSPPEPLSEALSDTVPATPIASDDVAASSDAAAPGAVETAAEAAEDAPEAAVDAAEAAVDAAETAAPVVASSVGTSLKEALEESNGGWKDEDEVEVEDDVEEDEEEQEEEEEEEDEEEDVNQQGLEALVEAMEADMRKQQTAAGLGMPNGEQAAAPSAGPSLPPLRGDGSGAVGLSGGSGGQSAGMRVMPAGMQSMLEALSRAQAQAAGSLGGPAAAAALAEEEETEMGRKLTELRVKLFRFARRMGQNEGNSVVAQVLYRLDLAERLQGVGRAGGPARLIGSAVRMDRVKALAEELENQEGPNSPLDFEVTVMLIGKPGVGKTATIHNLLGLPFGPSEAKPTKAVTLTVGDVHGVTFRMIEVPGLHPAAANAGKNLKTLRAAKNFLGKKQPDAVLYVDRLDWHSRDIGGDLELVKPISEVFGPAIWVSTVGLLTHGAVSPPEDDQGRVMSYEIYTAHRTMQVQNTMRHAAGDVRLTNPVVLAENHPQCRTSRTGDKILPNGQAWRPHVLLTCLAGRCLADGHELLQKSGGGPQGAAARPTQQRQRLPPLAFLLSNLLQKKAPVKLPAEQGLGDDDDDDGWDDDFDSEEVDFDSLPPFRRLTKGELQHLSPAQQKEYHQELSEREKLFQKKQWREELYRRRELRKMAEEEEKTKGSKAGGVKEQKPGGEDTGAVAEEDEGPSNVPVPSPEMDIPLSFDSDHPTFRYRHLPSDSEWMLRPVSELNGWDHDVGFNTFQVEKSTALLASKRLPAFFNAQVEKDKKDCAVQLEAGASVRHGAAFPGSTPVTTVSLDMQLAGKEHRMGTLRADARFGLLRRNKLGVGCSLTKYPDMAIIPGIKVEDVHNFGRRVSMVAAAGMVKHGRYAAKGLSIESQIRPADHPIGRNLHQLGLSLLDWQGDLVIGANATSQLQIGNSTLLVLRGNINNRAAGTISVRCSSSEHMQLAAVALVPLLRYFLGGGFLFHRRGDTAAEGADPWQQA